MEALQAVVQELEDILKSCNDQVPLTTFSDYSSCLLHTDSVGDEFLDQKIILEGRSEGTSCLNSAQTSGAFAKEAACEVPLIGTQLPLGYDAVSLPEPACLVEVSCDVIDTMQSDGQIELDRVPATEGTSPHSIQEESSIRACTNQELPDQDQCGSSDMINDPLSCVERNSHEPNYYHTEATTGRPDLMSLSATDECRNPDKWIKRQDVYLAAQGVQASEQGPGGKPNKLGAVQPNNSVSTVNNNDVKMQMEKDIGSVLIYKCPPVNEGAARKVNCESLATKQFSEKIEVVELLQLSNSDDSHNICEYSTCSVHGVAVEHVNDVTNGSQQHAEGPSGPLKIASVEHVIDARECRGSVNLYTSSNTSVVNGIDYMPGGACADVQNIEVTENQSDNSWCQNTSQESMFSVASATPHGIESLPRKEKDHDKPAKRPVGRPRKNKALSCVALHNNKPRGRSRGRPRKKPQSDCVGRKNVCATKESKMELSDPMVSAGNTSKECAERCSGVQGKRGRGRPRKKSAPDCVGRKDPGTAEGDARRAMCEQPLEEHPECQRTGSTACIHDVQLESCKRDSAKTNESGEKHAGHSDIDIKRHADGETPRETFPDKRIALPGHLALSSQSNNDNLVTRLPEKRPRGRPRKVEKTQPVQREVGSSLKVPNVETSAHGHNIGLSQQTIKSDNDDLMPVKRKRGRPRKKRRFAAVHQPEVCPADCAVECQTEEGNAAVLTESLCSSLNENSQVNGEKMITVDIHGQEPALQAESLHQESVKSLTNLPLHLRKGENKLANSQELKNLCSLTGSSDEEHETDGDVQVTLETHECNGVPQLFADGSQQPTMTCDELIDQEPPVLQKISDEVNASEQLPYQYTKTERKRVRFPVHNGDVQVGHTGPTNMDLCVDKPVIDISVSIHDRKGAISSGELPGESHEDVSKHVQTVLPRKSILKPGKRPVGRPRKRQVGRPRKHALKHPTLQPTKQMKNQIKVDELVEAKEGGPGLLNKHESVQHANYKAVQECAYVKEQQVFGHTRSSTAANNTTEIEATSLDQDTSGEHKDLKASGTSVHGSSNVETSTVAATEDTYSPFDFPAIRRRGRPRKHFHNGKCPCSSEVKTPLSPLIRPKRNVKSRYARPHSDQTQRRDPTVHPRRRGRPRKSEVHQDTGCHRSKEQGINNKVRTSTPCKKSELRKHRPCLSLSTTAQRQNDFVKGSPSPLPLNSKVTHAQQSTCQVYAGYNHRSLSPQRVIPVVCYSERSPQLTGDGGIIPSFQLQPENACHNMCSQPFAVNLQGTDKCSKNCADHIAHDEGCRRVPTICLQKIPEDMMTGTLTLDANDVPTGYSAGTEISSGKYEQLQKFDICEEGKSKASPTSMVQSRRSSGGSIVRLNTSRPCQYLGSLSLLTTDHMISDYSTYQPENRVISLNIGQSNECHTFEHASIASEYVRETDTDKIPPKRRRGRPRKNFTVSSNTYRQKLAGTMVNVTKQLIVHHKSLELIRPTATKIKKRGRPRKSPGLFNICHKNATSATGGALVLPNSPRSNMRRRTKMSKSSVKIAKTTAEVDVQSNFMSCNAGKRKVGRPRKHPEVVKLPVMSFKRRRGRPGKVRAPSFHEVGNKTGTEPKTSRATDSAAQGISVGKPRKSSEFSRRTAIPKRKVGRPRIHPEVKAVKKRGRPRKNREPEKMRAPKKRGRPRLKPESDVRRKRGRPRLHVEPKAKKKRGRPCLNPNSQTPKKRGRPRKHPVTSDDPPKYPLVPLPITDKLIFGPFAFQAQEMLHCNFASSQASTLFQSSSNAVSASETGTNEMPTEDFSQGENAVDVTPSCILENACVEGEVCSQDQHGQKSSHVTEAETSWMHERPAFDEANVIGNTIPSPARSDDPATSHQFVSSVHLECSSPESPGNMHEPHQAEGCTATQLQTNDFNDLPETAVALESVATMDSAMFLTCLRLNDKSSIT